MDRLFTDNEENMVTGRDNFSDNANKVLESRYLDRNNKGEIVETPREMMTRVAKHIASAESENREEWEKKFFDQMWEKKFIPNSPTMMNAGRRLGQLSACFCVRLDDSIEDIMDTAKDIALIQRSGGGTGINLDKLRPSDSIVRSSGGTTSGPLTFLEMFSGVTDAIQQGAFRRGANMGTMSIEHPDIVHFIKIKEDKTKVTNYNLSCLIPDKWMNVVNDDPSQLHIVRNRHLATKALLRKEDGTPDYEAYLKMKDAGSCSAIERGLYYTVSDLMELILSRAWGSGEPGLLFIDAINRDNPTPHIGEIRCVNPCGELPLLESEACTLGSINLAHFYRESFSVKCDSETNSKVNILNNVVKATIIIPQGGFDIESFKDTVAIATRFLDNVVEVNNYPTQEIDKMCRANRKTGLGIMGWADLLFKSGIRYDSEEALSLARTIGTALREVSHKTSELLAEERGCFDNWEGSMWDKRGIKMRNAHTTSAAPTGTISIIAGCSGGVEPIFSLAYKRQIMKDAKGKHTTMWEINSIFLDALRDEGFNQEDIDIITEHVGSVGTLSLCPIKLPEQFLNTFRACRDIKPEWHVKMQAAWQENIDSAISKTCNFSEYATIDDVKKAYFLAHELGCKGITVYRDNSRAEQPMALSGSTEGNKKMDKIDNSDIVAELMMAEHPACPTCVS